MPTSEKPLARLRAIRDAQRRAEEMAADRDALIRRAIVDEELSYRTVAQAAGLTAGRVKQIVDGR